MSPTYDLEPFNQAFQYRGIRATDGSNTTILVKAASQENGALDCLDVTKGITIDSYSADCHDIQQLHREISTWISTDT